MSLDNEWIDTPTETGYYWLRQPLWGDRVHDEIVHVYGANKLYCEWWDNTRTPEPIGEVSGQWQHISKPD